MLYVSFFRRFAPLLVALTAVFFGSPALAQGNLLENPGFDEDLSGWENPQARRGEWSSLDAANSPISGSALVYNDADPSNGATPTVLRQCVPAAGSTEYIYGGQIRVPQGQPENSRGEHFVIEYASGDCSGGSNTLRAVGSNVVDAWTPVSETFVTDSTTASISFTIGVQKPNGVSDPASANFDNPYLRQTDSSGYRIIDEKLSGAWYNPETSGQGIYLSISMEANSFIGGWFTWTDTLGEIDWMTVQGGFSGDLATLTVYRSSGGKFNDPAEVTTEPIGIAEFRFPSCTTAEFSFMFDGETEFTEVDMIRAGPAFKGCTD